MLKLIDNCAISIRGRIMNLMNGRLVLKHLAFKSSKISLSRYPEFGPRTGPMSSVTRRERHEWADPERERQMRAPSKIKINVVHRRSYRPAYSLARSRIAHALSAPPSAEESECSAVCRFPLSVFLSLSLILFLSYSPLSFSLA